MVVAMETGAVSSLVDTAMLPRPLADGLVTPSTATRTWSPAATLGTATVTSLVPAPLCRGLHPSSAPEVRSVTLYWPHAESAGNTYPVDASSVTLSVPAVRAWVATKLTRILTPVAPASDDVAVSAVSLTDVPDAPAGTAVAAVMPTPMARAMRAHMKALIKRRT